MEYVVLGLCAVIVALGVLALLSPTSFARILRASESSIGLWAASASRILTGIVFYLAAPSSRAPEVMESLGILFVAVGLLVPVLGRESLNRTVELFLSAGTWLTRSWGAVAILFGVSVGYGFFP